MTQKTTNGTTAKCVDCIMTTNDLEIWQLQVAKLLTKSHTNLLTTFQVPPVLSIVSNS